MSLCVFKRIFDGQVCVTQRAPLWPVKPDAHLVNVGSNQRSDVRADNRHPEPVVVPEAGNKKKINWAAAAALSLS
nr:hypothetical protein BaRGS_025500 [Batillaria attramentaria]